MPRRRIERSSGTNCQPFFYVFFLHRCLVLHSRNKSGSCSSRPRVFAWFFKPPSIIIHLVSTCFHFPHFPPVSIHFGILLVSVKTKVGSAMETARAIRSFETWNVLESLGVRARRPPIDLAKKNGCDIFGSVIFPYCVPWHFLDLFQKTARVIRWEPPLLWFGCGIRNHPEVQQKADSAVGAAGRRCGAPQDGFVEDEVQLWWPQSVGSINENVHV